MDTGTCPSCGETGLSEDAFWCDTCGAKSTVYIHSCGYNAGTSSVTHKTIECSTCGGDGKVSTTKTCGTCNGSGEENYDWNRCEHGYYEYHYYCQHQNYRSSSASHKYCEHSSSGTQHD